MVLKMRKIFMTSAIYLVVFVNAKKQNKRAASLNPILFSGAFSLGSTGRIRAKKLYTRFVYEKIKKKV